jgi:hypothetical protein
MERMTKSRSDDLCKGGTQGAGLIGAPVRLRSHSVMARIGDVAEFVNHGTLLCHHQQQQEA